MFACCLPLLTVLHLSLAQGTSRILQEPPAPRRTDTRTSSTPAVRSPFTSQAPTHTHTYTHRPSLCWQRPYRCLSVYFFLFFSLPSLAALLHVKNMQRWRCFSRQNLAWDYWCTPAPRPERWWRQSCKVGGQCCTWLIVFSCWVKKIPCNLTHPHTTLSPRFIRFLDVCFLFLPTSLAFFVSFFLLELVVLI